MKTIKIWSESPSTQQLNEICSNLESGKIVIIPTDTLYGVTCDALNVKAIDKICSLKNINPQKTNLSILCSDIAMAADYAKIDNRRYELLKRYTPGPFTFLFPALHSLPKAFKGRKTVGIRIPDNPITLAILKHFGRPLLSTSIEFSDPDYAINPELIAEAYSNKADVIAIGGEGGMEPSAIIDYTTDQPILTREGPAEIDL